MILTLEKIAQEAGGIAPKYHVKSTMLFGSYADGSANDDSDVDLLVKFDQKAVSLLRFFVDISTRFLIPETSICCVQ